MTAEEMAGLFIHHIFPQFGLPLKFISDRDPKFCYNASYRWPLSHRGHKGTAEKDIRLY